MFSLIKYTAAILPFSPIKLMRALTCTMLIVVVVSCTSGKKDELGRKPAAGTGAGVATTPMPAPLTGGAYALELSPKEPTRDTIVTLLPRGFDPSSVKIDWLLNNTPFTTQAPNQFNGADAAKGDSLQARATIEGREVLSNTVQIKNAPPKIASIKLLDVLNKPGDALGVEVTGSDIDGDKVSFLYEWTINGEPAGTEGKIGRSVKRGDRVSVKVTPFDGESYGSFGVLDREIQNLPPIIQENTDFQFDGTVYTYQVKASDPDGDPLTYSIESPAEGMTIDRAGGLVTWNVPSEFKGRKTVTIVVSDGQGGTARYVLSITIK